MTVKAASAAARLSVSMSWAVRQAIFALVASIAPVFSWLMVAAAMCANSIAAFCILAAPMAAF